MDKFVTITFRSGVTLRPFHDGDVEGDVEVNKVKGRLRIHPSREAACQLMDRFWAAKGFDMEQESWAR